ncbi:MAG: Na+:solute symporter [Flavobacteriales bacterium]|nr:Na+:solute symporter [Flavobacteriales bacterium]
MNLQWIDWAIVAGFMLLFLWIGLRYQKKASGSVADFFLGGRNLPWYIAGLSMVATTFAADTPLAVTEITATKGISGNWLWWNMVTGGLLTTFLFSRLWRRSGVVTELELIEFRYSGKTAAFLRGFKSIYLGVVMNCMIIAWVNIAMATIIMVFFEISQIEAICYTGLLMLVASFYSALSGLLGVAITDVIQFTVAIIGCVVLAFYVVNSPEVGSIEEMKTIMGDDFFSLLPSQAAPEKEATNSFVGYSLTIGGFLAFMCIQWWASWYPGGEPGGGGYVAQRMLSTKDEEHSFKATLLFQVCHFCLRPWPWIIVAICAVFLYSPQINFPNDSTIIKAQFFHEAINSDDQKVKAINLYPEVTEMWANEEKKAILEAGVGNSKRLVSKDMEVLYPSLSKRFEEDPKFRQNMDFAFAPRLGYVFAMKDYLPTGLIGLLLAAFLAAYMSTISTQVNWGSSFLVNDLFSRFIKPSSEYESEEIAQRDYVKWGRIFSVLIMIVGFCISFIVESISGIWELIMEFGAGLGLVLILRWLWWRINAWSEITATIAPAFAYFICKIFIEPSFELADGSNVFIANKGTFLVTVGFTTIAWLVTTYLTSPVDRKHLLTFYNKVTPPGSWGPVRAEAENTEQQPILWQLIGWVSSSCMVYGVLFSTGYILLGNEGKFKLTLAMAIIGGGLTWYSIRQTVAKNRR